MSYISPCCAFGAVPGVQLAGGLCLSQRNWQRLTVPLEMVAAEIFYYSKEGRCSLTGFGVVEERKGWHWAPVTACRNNNGNVSLGIGVGLHSGIKSHLAHFQLYLQTLTRGSSACSGCLSS